MKTVLAIESSCDETAVAVVRGDEKQCEVLSSEIYSQIELHREYGGVVPELASRNHGLQLRPLLKRALEKAGVSVGEIDAFEDVVLLFELEHVVVELPLKNLVAEIYAQLLERVALKHLKAENI